MAPPPRPPIICYDLRTNENIRPAAHSAPRIPVTSATVRKPKVTIVHRNPLSRPKVVREPRVEKDYVPRYHSPIILAQAPKEDPRCNSYKARFAYSQKLKSDAKERERRQENKRRQLAVQAQLDEITAQLEAAKRAQENLMKTFGMSHNTARYIQKQDEDFARLREKVDRFSECRSRELGNRIQQLKCNQDLNSKSRHYPTCTSSYNSGASSSTISISSCSSPISIAEQTLPSFHLEESTTTDPSSDCSILPPIQHNRPNTSYKSITNDLTTNEQMFHATPKKCFSFYKYNPEANETVEVDDMDFFEKVEDKTMMEVNELLGRMQSVLRDMKN